MNILTGNATVTDPDLGTFTVGGTNIIVPINSEGLPVGIDGTINVTATDGTTGSVTVDSNGIVTIAAEDENGAAVTQQVDCTELVYTF